jgi:hypothetical protein
MPGWWPWTRTQRAADPLETAVPPSETLPPAVAQPIAARLTDLEAQVSQLQLAWSETLDKLTAWGNRQAARERRRADRALDQLGGDPSNGAETHEDALGATNGADLTTGSLVDRAARKAALRAQLRGR